VAAAEARAAAAEARAAEAEDALVAQASERGSALASEVERLKAEATGLRSLLAEREGVSSAHIEPTLTHLLSRNKVNRDFLNKHIGHTTKRTTKRHWRRTPAGPA